MVDSEWEYRRGKLIPKGEAVRGRGNASASTRGNRVREISDTRCPTPSEREYTPTRRLRGRKGHGSPGGRARGRLYHPPSHIRVPPTTGTFPHLYLTNN